MEDEQQGMTYAQSGVDIEKEVDGIKALAAMLAFKRTGTGAPAELGGHFTGLVEFGENYLSMCTDGAGSKPVIANLMKKWDTVGIDCVAMNSNDMICIGAEPIALVDYIAIEEPSPHLMAELGKGLNKGAEESNATIIGGETASHPDTVDGFDIAATCLGYVKKDELIDGSGVSEGDVIIGIPSSGIHCNGYTLVRKVIEASEHDYDSSFDDICSSLGIEPLAEQSGMTLGGVCLIPTIIYVRPVIELIRAVRVHGLVHVTGGGLKNLPRINSTVDYLIEQPLDPHPVFNVVQNLGRVSDEEMYKTFNMGMGFCIILPEDRSAAALEILFRHYPGSRLVGKVVNGNGICRLVPLGLEYSGL